jgi:(p)ppGpp synthase/HD superfamily hydrolase
MTMTKLHGSTSARFNRALTYATDIHATQRRKGTSIPYISHLLAVAGIVLEFGGDEDEAVAALLHDAVEDQGGPSRLEDIRVQFGDHVAAIVEACSDTDVVPKPPWRERKEAYLAHLDRATQSTRLVSAADKLANVRSIVQDYRQVGEELWDRFTGGRSGTLWYYRALAEAFSRLGPAPLATELAAAVAELERLTADGPPPP